MNTPLQARALCLVAAAAVTFVLVHALAAIGYPEPAAPQMAQAAVATCLR